MINPPVKEPATWEREFKKAFDRLANKPIRQEILEYGISITVGDRNTHYGDPLINLGLAGQLSRLCEDAYRANRKRTIGPGEWNAIQHVLIKIARLITGGKLHRDNYIDGANYFAIAGECAEREAE